jgi:serine/threonine protein kinase
MFLSGSKLWAGMWEQEGRALTSLANWSHPAIIDIHEAGIAPWIPEEGAEPLTIGYVVSERSDYTLADPKVRATIRKDPAECIRQLMFLAEALSILRGEGIAHRNLSPASILARWEEGGKLRLRIGRFEMSTFQGNVLRWGRAARDAVPSSIHVTLVNQGPEALATMAPRRLEELFDRDASEGTAVETDDVYALGVLAYLLLIGPLPEAELDQAFPRRPAAYDPREWSYNEKGWAALHAEMVRRIHTHEKPRWPIPLRDLLVSMISQRSRNRPTAREVFEHLKWQYDALMAELDAEGTPPERRPFAVAIAPERFEVTFWRWGWLAFHPETDDGIEELSEVIEQDLANGFLEHCPGGFTSIEPGADRDKEEAEFVLRGARAAYFACPFRALPEGKEVPEALMIRYVLSWSDPRSENLPQARFRKRLPSCRVYHFRAEQLRPSSAERSLPSWEGLRQHVRHEPPFPPRHALVRDTIRLLLEVQEIELSTRQYAFTRVGENVLGEVTVRFDEERDLERRLKRPRLGLYASSAKRRPAFQDFFTALDGGVRWWPDWDGLPLRDRTRSGTGEMVKKIGAGQITFRISPGSASLPERGWLEPEDDYLARRLHERQADAFRELLDRRSLLGALADRIAFIAPLAEWDGCADGFTSNSGRPIRALEGTAIDVLRKFLDATPILAVQGPPGTGKTTIAARAVRAMLKQRPTTRLLVSAQSHYALDHLAATILDWVPDDPAQVVPVRIASRHSRDRVEEPAVKAILPDKLGESWVEKILQRCDVQIKRDRTLDGHRRDIVSRWANLVRASQLEIQERVARAANLVFVTCGGATPYALGEGLGGSFDWVIIEEAAKAWPTELIVPLVRGRRWTLIGDHMQLQAYRWDDVVAFIKQCAEPLHDTTGEIRARLPQILQVLEIFRRFFEPDPADPHAAVPTAGVARRRAFFGLAEQHRMEKRIGTLVSTTFYQEELTHGIGRDQTHDLTEPPEFQGHSLVWLDTGKESGFFEQPRWRHPQEVRVIQGLLHRLHPAPAPPGQQREGVKTLAILAPYADQVQLLKTEMPEWGPCIHTVDSFQGHEADIVVISLVRDSDIPSDLVRQRIGFLGNQNRVNVLLSRARSLLILVGDLDHFRQAGELALKGGLNDPREGEFWLNICYHFEKDGLTLPAGRFLPDRPASGGNPR